jgi:hypothetical protein
MHSILSWARYLDFSSCQGGSISEGDYRGNIKKFRDKGEIGETAK